ncbi:DUF1127 domain-containing protein [Rhizobium straminoryzae]|uniref:DUF1127 domain-containing protein n=1 Tax=Rhizobium straminoryzae TaxID=1387186 RepID=A0A549TB79_9HYPH|nr:DUF1127 domain-containing protein [Rhizobium straminoryzae]TRL39141.1 DUF1127 domain-containing protein [Rhizobium straminoryzae]
MSTTERMTSRAIAARRTPDLGLLTDVIAAATNVLRVFRNRKALNQLSELEDHQLADIGLTRRDVDIAMNQTGAFDDPFKLLPAHVRGKGRRRS